MSQYMTRQRRLLLEYLHAHADELLAAGQIVSALEAQGVSASAVYRNLAALTGNGTLQSVSKSGSKQSCYRLVDNAHCVRHLHLSCKKCGRTYHMDDAQSEAIIQSIAQQEEFTIDRKDTVLYGLCKGCRES